MIYRSFQRLLNVQAIYRQSGMDVKIPKYWVGVLFWDYWDMGNSGRELPHLQTYMAARNAGKNWLRLQQIQLAGTGYRFGAPLDLQFVKDNPRMTFHRAQGEEKSFTDLAVR